MWLDPKRSIWGKSDDRWRLLCSYIIDFCHYYCQTYVIIYILCYYVITEITTRFVHPRARIDRTIRPTYVQGLNDREFLYVIITKLISWIDAASYRLQCTLVLSCLPACLYSVCVCVCPAAENKRIISVSVSTMMDGSSLLAIKAVSDWRAPAIDHPGARFVHSPDWATRRRRSIDDAIEAPGPRPIGSS